MTGLSSDAGRRPVVLVVEGDADQRSLIEHALRRASYDVRTAGSADEALGKLDGVDVVLLDHRLPDMTGIELLRTMSRRTGPAVVLVTEVGDEDVVVDALRAGAVDFVVKGPTYFDEPAGVVERACRHHDVVRRARELQRLALLVHSALDRDAMCNEIVQGARQLLRSGSAGLFVTGSDGGVHMLAGDSRGSSAVAARVASIVRNPDRPKHTSAGNGCLVVPLPRAEGVPVGALAVWDREQRAASAEEVELAETFAAFAATALANAARLELQRVLVTELQETLDLRRNLVMSLSHELRTPLTCVVGFADTLVAEWETLDDDDVRRVCMRSIRENAHELRALVEQLLDFAESEAGRLTGTARERLPLASEVSAAVDALGPMLADRPVTVDIGEVEVDADPLLLRRTLANLLTNAAKHSAPGVPVAVRAVAEGDVVRVEVEDAGQGMTADELAHAFEPFWRGETARSGAARGSGLGLALVREYVRLMGGEVVAESSPGAGARFSFTVPVRPAP
ncbi:MAG TPA: ATP-binding protein [Acidimicrobiales bacterium]|nr:ATP-binding protein [Acidimicrobiales bacterium]